MGCCRASQINYVELLLLWVAVELLKLITLNKQGTYSSQEAANTSSTCVKCSAGYFSDVMGANISSVCQPCPAGTFSSVEGLSSKWSCRFDALVILNFSGFAVEFCATESQETSTGIAALDTILNTWDSHQTPLARHAYQEPTSQKVEQAISQPA